MNGKAYDAVKNLSNEETGEGGREKKILEALENCFGSDKITETFQKDLW